MAASRTSRNQQERLLQDLVEGQNRRIRSSDAYILVLERRIQHLEERERAGRSTVEASWTRRVPSEAAQALGTASPPASTSFSAALRLQALAASLSQMQTEDLQRDAEIRLENSRDRRRAIYEETTDDSPAACRGDDEGSVEVDNASDDSEMEEGDEDERDDAGRLRLGIVDRDGVKIIHGVARTLRKKQLVGR